MIKPKLDLKSRRMQGDGSFVFKRFAEDVDPQGQQNHAASYNSGVTAALFLRELDKVAHELIKIR